MAHTARSAVPLVDESEWQRRAACRDCEDTAFFHPPGEHGASWRERVQRARQVCARCPVQQRCLDYSLDAEEPFGTWGGVDEQRRWKIILRRRTSRGTNPRSMVSPPSSYPATDRRPASPARLATTARSLGERRSDDHGPTSDRPSDDRPSDDRSGEDGNNDDRDSC